MNHPGNIKVVRTVTYCGNEVGTFGGCAEVGARNMVVARNASSTVLAHEVGHNQGIAPHAACFPLIMYNTDFDGKALTEAEATYFLTPLPNAQYSTGAPCPLPIPDVTHSYYVPQSGSYSSPVEGTNAVRNFRGCPNNDGGSFPNTARIKVVLRDSNNAPLSGVPATDIYLLFNGGTSAQGFLGSGADSIIANSAYNFNPPCPDVRQVVADGPTNGAGEAYITFKGAGGARNASRKWGHYDAEIPVYVNGARLEGKLTSGDVAISGILGEYKLQLKSIDWSGGLLGSHPADDNVGEQVDPGDFNGIANGIGDTGPLSFWKDLDWSGHVDSSDFNIVVAHFAGGAQGGPHTCVFPMNP